MIEKLKQALSRFHRDDAGAMKIEMILILVLISLPLLVVLFLFRDKIIGYFQTESDKLGEEAGQGPNYTP
ncbi:MAG: hypothetical protein FWD61_09035 [Phycisphaerales bacterium]|nr:hypothetical protein [Phycisphaerales bacterium]